MSVPPNEVAINTKSSVLTDHVTRPCNMPSVLRLKPETRPATYEPTTAATSKLKTDQSKVPDPGATPSDNCVNDSPLANPNIANKSCVDSPAATPARIAPHRNVGTRIRRVAPSL